MAINVAPPARVIHCRTDGFEMRARMAFAPNANNSAFMPAIPTKVAIKIPACGAKAASVAINCGTKAMKLSQL